MAALLVTTPWFELSHAAAETEADVAITEVDVATVTQADVAPEPVNAVWLERQVNFTYFATRVYYSCNAIQTKVRYVLLKLGALPHTLQVVSSCMAPGFMQAASRVRIKAALPAQVTPELVARFEEEAPRRELIARVRGQQPIDLATAQFPAVWTTVEFNGRRDRRLADADCELLQQLSRSVFESLGVRLAPGTKLHCSSGPLGSVRFQAETLQPVPQPDRAALSTTG